MSGRFVLAALAALILTGCTCHRRTIERATASHYERTATVSEVKATDTVTIERERVVWLSVTDTVTDTVRVTETVRERRSSDLRRTYIDTVTVFDTVTVTQAAATTGDTRHRRQWWKLLTELIGCFVTAFAVVKFGEFFAEILKKSR